ncbi:MAG TPA: hypothetical protein PLW86_15460, partial [Rhodocyclaceae bacterium]|nr:hypothetical protein [Rhodocyclaceae bacterium]
TNPVMGIKWRFYDNQESGTSLAIKPELHLPISADREAKGLGSGRTSWLLTAALTQTVSFGAVHFTLGMAGSAIVNPAAIPSCRSRIFRSRRFGK